MTTTNDAKTKTTKTTKTTAKKSLDPVAAFKAMNAKMSELSGITKGHYRMDERVSMNGQRKRTEYRVLDTDSGESVSGDFRTQGKLTDYLEGAIAFASK